MHAEHVHGIELLGRDSTKLTKGPGRTVASIVSPIVLLTTGLVPFLTALLAVIVAAIDMAYVPDEFRAEGGSGAEPERTWKMEPVRDFPLPVVRVFPEPVVVCLTLRLGDGLKGIDMSLL